MTEFALERSSARRMVLHGASVDVAFGPASPGALHVILSAGVATRSRPHAPTTGGNHPGDAPGGGGFPDPPPPDPIDGAAFRLEVLDAHGTSLGAGPGPLLSLTVPTPPLPVGPAATAPIAVHDTWRVKVTNNSAFDANIAVEVRFHGQRPILSKPYALDFANDRFDAVFNAVQPIRLRFENRTEQLPPPFSITRTWLVVDATESWKLAHPELRGLELDLGSKVLTEVTQTTRITLKACVHDGAPAVRVRVQFQQLRGVVDLLNLLRLWSSTLAEIGDLYTDLTPADRPTVAIGELSLDVFLVLRPGRFDPRGTFEVIARPTIALDSPNLALVARALAQTIFETGLPERLGSAMDGYARSFAAWLLGDRDRELVGGEEHLEIQYVGDAPRPQVVAPTTASPTSVSLSPGNLSKIDHIVVVMMENRSFDHMLGYLSLPAAGPGDVVGAGRTNVDGLTGTEVNLSGLRDNQARHVFPLSRPWTGPALPPTLRTRPTRFVPDPGHSYADTLVQRGGFDVELRPAGSVEPGEAPEPAIVVHLGPNGGFVLNFADRIVRSGAEVDADLVRRLAGEVMGYHPAAHVPTYDHLAARYAVCDRWFAAHPGHTWPNRFVTLTGRLNVGPDGRPEVDNPDPSTFDPLETPTIVDHLLTAGVTCQYFEHDFCMLRVFSRYTFDETVIAPIDDPARGFFARARAGKLPAVSFVEPDLTGVETGNDDHPPADVRDGQHFLHRVYDALVTGPAAQWAKTLLLITYDEHGGFYDHVHPEEQTPLFDAANPLKGGFVPIAFEPGTTKPITHYGMRVPALVVSPWVKEATVSSTQFDHTSILNTIIARFLNANPPDMGWRVAHAEHVGPLLSRPTVQGPVFPPATPPLAPRVLLRQVAPRPVVADPQDREFRDFMRGFRDRVRSR